MAETAIVEEIRAGMKASADAWSKRENHRRCMALREVIADVQTAQGPVKVEPFGQVYNAASFEERVKLLRLAGVESTWATAKTPWEKLLPTDRTAVKVAVAEVSKFVVRFALVS